MNGVQLNLQLLSNRLYEYVWRSPALLLRRVEDRVNRSIGRSARVTARPTTHAITWVREADDFHTRLYLFNYWTEHYGIDRMPIRVIVHDAGGRQVGETAFVVEPREMRVVEAADVLREAGVRAPFTGSLIVERRVEGAGFGAPLKLLQEYHGPGFAVSIHEYGTRENFTYREYQTGVSLWDDPEVEDVFVGLVNCNYAGAPRGSRLSIEVRRHDGERMSTPADFLAPGGAAFLSLERLVPGWRAFLGGKPGMLGLRFGNSIGRPLIFHRYKSTGTYCLNHMTGDKSRQAAVLRGADLAAVKDGPIWGAGVVVDENVTSVVTMMNNWGFDSAFRVRCGVFEKDGSTVTSFDKVLEPWEVWALDIGDVLRRLGRTGPFAGGVRLHIVADGFIPFTYDGNMEYVGRGWRQAVNVGCSVLNLPQKVNVKSDQNSRTKNFLRVRRDSEWETLVSVVNQSSDPGYMRASDTTVRLISRDGKREITRRLSIPPNGTLYATIDEIFGDGVDEIFNGESVATMHLRDTTVKLVGVHILRDRKKGVLSGDHYFGG